MFTGIITDLGKVYKKTDSDLKLEASLNLLSKLTKGLSISVNGICLTVVGKTNKDFKVEFMPETEKKTNIKYLQTGDLVNLELPARAATFLSGHIVQGHIDGTARLINISKQKNSLILKLSIPTNLSGYIVEKGSIALNGISLTVIEAGKDYFTVGIIPFTWENTMLHTAKTEDFLNVEADILAKYLEKLKIKHD